VGWSKLFALTKRVFICNNDPENESITNKKRQERNVTMKIDNQTTIVITGASRGLGAHIARSFAQQGAKLVLLDKDKNALKAIQSELSVIEVESHCFDMDVSQEDSVIRTFEAIDKQFGHIDVLINNAGILNDGLLIKPNEDAGFDGLSLSRWQSVIDVNLTGVFLCGREAARVMAKKGKGVIINMSSICRAGNIGQSNYAAAKAGVVALSTTWAKELAQYGIRCAAIAPGFIETEMTQSMPEKAISRVKQMIPLQSMGQMEHIAQTAQFIIENDYLTGRVIEIDGGLRL
jgi:3-oxoacyl-[acyl-carrier protein] reductase